MMRTTTLSIIPTEIYAESNGQILIGDYTGGCTGGHNEISDTANPSAGEKLVYNDSSFDAVAENNYWGGDPDAGDFYGTIDYDPYLPCERRAPKVSADANNYLLQRILAARKKVTDSYPDYREDDVAHLYVMQQLDREDILGERAKTLAVIADVRNTSIQMGKSVSPGLQAAGERAMLIEIHDALTNEKYSDAKQFVSSYDQYITTGNNTVELLMAEIGLHEYDQEYVDALTVTAEIRALEKKKGEFDVMLDIVEQTLRERIEESTGVMPTLPAPKITESNSGNRDTEHSDERAIPSNFELLSPYPNPFNPSVIIPFNLPVASRVEMTVFDILGRRVATIVDRFFEEGSHAVVFRAGRLSSGAYIVNVRMQSLDGLGYSTSRLISLRK